MPRTQAIVIGIAALILASPVAFFLLAARPRAEGPAGFAHMLALDAALPVAVPPGQTLVVGDPVTQRVLEHTGWDKTLPFQVKWVHMTGGPAVTEAFHARALDVGLAADIPPIHAVWVGIPVKIIAVELRRDPRGHPSWKIAAGPRSNIRTLADLRGKRIAFSPGQVQGEVVLRTLAEHGLTRKDVTLVEMPSTSADVYVNALISGQIDAAPIANGVNARRYLADFGRNGAKVLDHGAFRDDLTNLYVRTETLQDPAKAAALREYVRLWARAQGWIEAHPDEWARTYYVEDQRLSQDDARYMVAVPGPRDIPRDWSQAIAQQQGAIDLMAKETGRARFASSTLFDRRFESVAADAFAAARPLASNP